VDRGQHTDASAKAEPRQPLPDAARRTYLLATALILAAGIVMTRLDLHVDPAVGWSMPFWAVGILAFATAFLVFNVEFRRETYTFTFAEIVLVVGLFFAAPAHFIVGRLLGELAFLVIRERQQPRKLIMNLSAFFAESVVLVAIEQMLLDGLDVREPLSWFVALVAVIGAELVGFAAIATAVRWHGGPITLRSIIQIGLITAPANTSLALVVCVLVDAEPAAVPLLGGVAAILVMTYRAYSSLKQRYDSLSLLYDFTHLVSGAREPDQVLDAMLAQAKDLLRAERAEFWLATGGATYRRHVVDDAGHTSARVTIPDALATLVERMPTERDSVLIARNSASEVDRLVLATLGASDALVAPILEGDTLIGFVAVVNRLSEIYSFEAQDARMFTTLASHAGVALQNGRLIVRLHEQARQREHEALHDPLTGLPNRAMFSDRLGTRLASRAEQHHDATVGIALMDLDGFKEINDTLGHQAGDEVLVEVARRLRVAVDDMLAVRLGGDEFALLAAPGTSHAELERACRRVRDAIAEPMSIDHLVVNMGVSIGIAVAPGDGDDADTLIRRADIAMYAAKAGHNGGVCFYDADRDENTPRRLALGHDMRVAVDAGQLRIVYQPKISLADGRITGVESLCRWEHPTFGLVMPDEFIPLAERTGAIGDLTRWMLSEAVSQCERWQAIGHPWGVAINVSVRNLLDAELVGIVGSVLAQSTIAPSDLTLEITETHVMSDSVRTTHVLEELAALGIRLSIDDFGTGYSSLAYLQRLPVDEVKIDKSFVRALAVEGGADAIVRSVLDLARNLDLWVVAEGVEDGATATRLRSLGCDEAQGFFYARPMAAVAVEPFARELALDDPTAGDDLVVASR
jgi:diguanylate cyclase (GGDEF)-like protein